MELPHIVQRRRFLASSALIASALAAGCAGGGAPGAGSRDVLDVSRDSGLARFVQAVEAADLAETLASAGPFTLFAPSDRAFAAMPPARLAALLRPDNREALRGFVGYHIVPGTFTTSFLRGIDVNYTTAAGASLNVDGTDGVRVNGANIVTADLAATNGVVHAIDRVIAPD